MACLDIGATPVTSNYKSHVGNGDGGVYFRGNNQNTDEVKNDKPYIPGTGSYPTGIPFSNDK